MRAARRLVEGTDDVVSDVPPIRSPPTLVGGAAARATCVQPWPAGCTRARAPLSLRPNRARAPRSGENRARKNGSRCREKNPAREGERSRARKGEGERWSAMHALASPVSRGTPLRISARLSPPPAAEQVVTELDGNIITAESLWKLGEIKNEGCGARRWIEANR